MSRRGLPFSADAVRHRCRHRALGCTEGSTPRWGCRAAPRAAGAGAGKPTRQWPSRSTAARAAGPGLGHSATGRDVPGDRPTPLKWRVSPDFRPFKVLTNVTFHFEPLMSNLVQWFWVAQISSFPPRSSTKLVGYKAVLGFSPFLLLILGGQAGVVGERACSRHLSGSAQWTDMELHKELHFCSRASGALIRPRHPRASQLSFRSTTQQSRALSALLCRSVYLEMGPGSKGVAWLALAAAAVLLLGVAAGRPSVPPCPSHPRSGRQKQGTRPAASGCCRYVLTTHSCLWLRIFNRSRLACPHLSTPLCAGTLLARDQSCSHSRGRRCSFPAAVFLTPPLPVQRRSPPPLWAVMSWALSSGRPSSSSAAGGCSPGPNRATTRRRATSRTARAR